MNQEDPRDRTVRRLVKVIDDGANYIEGLVASYHNHPGHWRDCQFVCEAMRAPAEQMRRELKRVTGIVTETNIGPFDVGHPHRRRRMIAPDVSERDRLIADIRSRLPMVAIGHPDLAAEIGRAMDLVDVGAAGAPR